MDELVRTMTISLPILETVYRVTECHALGDTPLELALGKHSERDNIILVLGNNMIGEKILHKCLVFLHILGRVVVGLCSGIYFKRSL